MQHGGMIARWDECLIAIPAGRQVPIGPGTGGDAGNRRCMGRTAELPTGMTKRGDMYCACFRSRGKLIRKKLSRDLKTAKRALHKLRVRADEENFDLVDNDYEWNQLKAEFLLWAQQRIRRPKEYKRDLETLERYAGVNSVREITPAYVFDFRKWRLAEGKSARTVNKEVNTLNNMLNRGVDWKRIGRNPIKDITPLSNDNPSKVRRSLECWEVEKIFAECPAYLLPVFRMFCTTGIRSGELVNLTFDDIDFERRMATVRSKHSKNHEAREFSLEDNVLAELTRLKDEAPRRRAIPGKTKRGRLSRKHVFVTQANTPFTNSGNILRSFYAICKRAGIEGAVAHGSIDVHALRVTFATVAMSNGAKPRTIQAILGHKTLDMTMRVYAKVTSSSMRDAVAALPFATMSAPDVVRFESAHNARASTSDGKKTPRQIAAN